MAKKTREIVEEVVRPVTEAELDRLDDETFGSVSEARLNNDVHRARVFGREDLEEASGLDRDIADFRRIGFSTQIAESAARGLARGTFFDFEDAAIMSSMFTDENGSRYQRVVLDSVLREREAN